MSPQAKTAIIILANVVLQLGAFLAPSTWPVYLHVVLLALTLGAALLALFHAPPGVVAAVQSLLDALSAGQTVTASHPAVTRLTQTTKARPALAMVATGVFCLIAGLTMPGCPPPANTNNVISQAAACAIDIVEDVSQSPTAQLLQQTITDCGITAAELYADIAQLVAQAGKVDAGAVVSTRRGAPVPRDVYVSHLQQWQQLIADGGAR